MIEHIFRSLAENLQANLHIAVRAITPTIWSRPVSRVCPVASPGHPPDGDPSTRRCEDRSMIAIIDTAVPTPRCGSRERLGVDSVLTADPAVIAAAERVIPAAPVAMAQLDRAGLVDCIRG